MDVIEYSRQTLQTDRWSEESLKHNNEVTEEVRERDKNGAPGPHVALCFCHEYSSRPMEPSPNKFQEGGKR
jgi:hypothetical protein